MAEGLGKELLKLGRQETVKGGAGKEGILFQVMPTVAHLFNQILPSNSESPILPHNLVIFQTGGALGPF